MDDAIYTTVEAPNKSLGAELLSLFQRLLSSGGMFIQIAIL